jgi:hypothetical protein
VSRNIKRKINDKNRRKIEYIKLIKDGIKMAGNFTEIDEEFICENCGKHVPKLGYSCRNHCPYCLHSKHVDINPGDRAEECHGDLVPVGAEIDSKKGYVIIFKCKKCGKLRRNKAAEDDNMDLIIKLTAMHNY